MNFHTESLEILGLIVAFVALTALFHRGVKPLLARVLRIQVARVAPAAGAAAAKTAAPQLEPNAVRAA